MADLLLNLVERRVLGVLIEKSLAQPEYYPMTLNALVAACNQKNNRDPVLDLDDGAVWHALDQLRQSGLVAKVLPAPGSRVERFRHDVDPKLGWPKAQKAIMAELLLRGPQTQGELRNRASRMYAFENADAVSAVIEWLSNQTPPLVAVAPRVPGQSAVRYRHTLYPTDEQPAGDLSGAAAAPASTTRPVQASTTRAEPTIGAPAIGPAAASELEHPSVLVEQLEGLQSEVAELHEAVAELRRRIDRLEGR